MTDFTDDKYKIYISRKVRFIIHNNLLCFQMMISAVLKLLRVQHNDSLRNTKAYPTKKYLS